ncbi:MAG: hypothetical protein L0215_07860, partial [Gemmataceae bacterium]|nr:hypothetical protein [Gemmataceae bacterium]
RPTVRFYLDDQHFQGGVNGFFARGGDGYHHQSRKGGYGKPRPFSALARFRRLALLLQAIVHRINPKYVVFVMALANRVRYDPSVFV